MRATYTPSRSSFERSSGNCELVNSLKCFLASCKGLAITIGGRWFGTRQTLQIVTGCELVFVWQADFQDSE